MKNSRQPEPQKKSIKDLILSRALFAIFLCIGCFIYGTSEGLAFYSQPFIALYNLSALILLFSVFYLIILYQIKSLLIFIYIQLIIDCFFITTIIYITGSFDSLFTFLYLLVIIYSSMLVLLKGSLFMATIISVQYAMLIYLEYYKILNPVIGNQVLSNSVDLSQVVYKIIIISGACFTIAILSGILALQARRANYELRIAQQHLSRVEKMNAMDEMLSGIAHEIKNPLASLSGSIQLLKEESRPGSSEEKLMQIILRETERLKGIVNDIRLFSKPGTAGAVQLNLGGVLKETVELVANDPEWQDRIEIYTQIQKNTLVLMDPVHFRQILWNLLTNAAQSIEGNGKIFIRLKTSKTNRVYLTIEDTGAGISQTDAPHIFDPFFTTKAEGSGLGLSIIHKIIDTYDGMIDFESEPGKGTVFTLVFNAV